MESANFVPVVFDILHQLFQSTKPTEMETQPRVTSTFPFVVPEHCYAFSRTISDDRAI